MKSKIFKSKLADIKIEIIENGWAMIRDNTYTIALGKYPNKRWELIEEALEYVKKGEVK